MPRGVASQLPLQADLFNRVLDGRGTKDALFLAAHTPTPTASSEDDKRRGHDHLGRMNRRHSDRTSRSYRPPSGPNGPSATNRSGQGEVAAIGPDHRLEMMCPSVWTELTEMFVFFK